MSPSRDGGSLIDGKAIKLSNCFALTEDKYVSSCLRVKRNRRQSGRSASAVSRRILAPPRPSSKCRRTARGSDHFFFFFFSIDVTALLFSFRLTFRRGGPLVVDEKKCSPRTRLIGTSTRAQLPRTCVTPRTSFRAHRSDRER